MTEIITTNGNEITGQQFSGSLFNDFVAWIDRSEKTARTYLTNLRQFAAWLKYAAITAPQRQDIILYRQWLTVEHDGIALAPDTAAGWRYRTDRNGEPVKVNCAASTVKAYLQSVKQFFKWTAANGLYPNIASNIHAPKVRQDTHKKDALQAGDVLTIENSIKDTADKKKMAAAGAKKDTAGRAQRATEQGKRLYAMYLLTVTAGLRTIEIHRADVKDFECKGQQAYIYLWGKGHSEADQKKAIAPEVAAAIRDYLNARTDKPTANSPLFVSTGNRSRGKRIATTTISTMLKEAMQAAGYDSPRLTAHSLRHTAGTAAMETNGGDLYATQQYMRHSDPKTTEIYLHTETEKADATTAQKIYNLFHGITETDSRDKLNSAIDRMTPAQLEQLAGIAAAMA